VVVIAPPKIKALEERIKLAGKSGRVSTFGPPGPEKTFTINPNKTFFKEITCASSYSYSPIHTKTVVELLFRGKLKVKNLISIRGIIKQEDSDRYEDRKTQWRHWHHTICFSCEHRAGLRDRTGSQAHDIKEDTHPLSHHRHVHLERLKEAIDHKRRTPNSFKVVIHTNVPEGTVWNEL
jgi:hypothetical protein